MSKKSFDNLEGFQAPAHHAQLFTQQDKPKKPLVRNTQEPQVAHVQNAQEVDGKLSYNIDDPANVSVRDYTQGRKGQRLPRITMAFLPEALEHIRLMGRLNDCTATDYVNRLILMDAKAKEKELKKARLILKGN